MFYLAAISHCLQKENQFALIMSYKGMAQGLARLERDLKHLDKVILGGNEKMYEFKKREQTVYFFNGSKLKLVSTNSNVDGYRPTFTN